VEIEILAATNDHQVTVLTSFIEPKKEQEEKKYTPIKKKETSTNHFVKRIIFRNLHSSLKNIIIRVLL